MPPEPLGPFEGVCTGLQQEIPQLRPGRTARAAGEPGRPRRDMKEPTREEKGTVFAHISRVINSKGQWLREQPFADKSRCELLIALVPPKITYHFRKVKRERKRRVGGKNLTFFS